VVPEVVIVGGATFKDVLKSVEVAPAPTTHGSPYNVTPESTEIYYSATPAHCLYVLFANSIRNTSFEHANLAGD